MTPQRRRRIGYARKIRAGLESAAVFVAYALAVPVLAAGFALLGLAASLSLSH